MIPKFEESIKGLTSGDKASFTILPAEGYGERNPQAVAQLPLEMLRLMNLNQYSNAAAQPGLAVEKVKNLKLPFPPYNEQVEITKVLKNISTTTDNLIQKLKSQIKTLKDYRKSLIFECVTGKKQIYKGEI
jgi:hypothetical protein